MISRDYLEETEIDMLKSVAILTGSNMQNYIGASMVKTMSVSSVVKILYNILLAAPSIAFAITKPFIGVDSWIYYTAAIVIGIVIPAIYSLSLHIYRKELVNQTNVFTAIAAYETCIISSFKLRELSRSESIQYINDYIFRLDYLPNK